MIVHVHATDILSSLCKWKRQKMVVFVVKRYAVREAELWRYAVRKAKIGRYAVRKGGVTLIYEKGRALSLDRHIAYICK